jgi:hypothetical protein
LNVITELGLTDTAETVNCPAVTKTRLTPIDEKRGAKEESVKLNTDPDEETTYRIPSPSVLPKENTMSTNAKVSPVVIPAVSVSVPIRSAVKESVAGVPAEVDSIDIPFADNC